MIFHVLSIPLYPTSKEITVCPFTQKVYKFCKSMTERGHTVFHYGHPDSEVVCTKHFSVISRETYDKTYGNQTWREYHNQNIQNSAHDEFNDNAAKLIKQNKQTHNDFVFAFWGIGHRNCLEKLVNDFILVEPSIGYDSACGQYRVFETYAQMHKLQFKIHDNGTGCFTDAVIPPGFYLDDFEFKKEKQDYILYLGRMIDAKGLQIAQDLSIASKTPIKFVGPQNQENSLNKNNPLAEYIHTVSYEERKSLLANAKVLILPPLYMEPCGWAMIEAFFSGTPVISTDWGGPSEYIKQGVTGYRCRSLNEFYHALKNIHKINPQDCRDYAERNFHIDKAAVAYENYCQHILDLRQYGFGFVKENCNFLVPEV